MHVRYITDVRTRIFNNTLYTIRKIEGHTAFGGCQCSRDCSCHEDFIPMLYTEYRVTKKWGKPSKPSIHTTKQLAYKQMRELNKAHKLWQKRSTN